jgi:hypothetical protein
VLGCAGWRLLASLLACTQPAAASPAARRTACPAAASLGTSPTPPPRPQAAQLLETFRQFKAREAAGLADLYANKLAALEDALLGAREEVFAAVEVRSAARVAGAACGCGCLIGREVAAVARQAARCN